MYVEAHQNSNFRKNVESASKILYHNAIVFYFFCVCVFSGGDLCSERNRAEGDPSLVST